MDVYTRIDNLPPRARGAVVAVGNFDGMHRGHRVVIGEAAAVAHGMGAPLAVMAFDPHPRQLFRPQDPPFRLTPAAARTRLLAGCGADIHFLLTFDLPFARRSAEDFVRSVLVQGLKARHVAIGYDFCFGHKRRGNAEMLLALGRELGFGVTVVTQASDETGGVYSSSRVRDLLRTGRPRAAAYVLDRVWSVEGLVQHGDQRGRLLGYPTANIDPGEHLSPAFGVYAVRCAVTDDPMAPDDSLTWHSGVANFGVRPMYQIDRPLLEAHLFDFSGDLYGRRLRVQMVDYLRGEVKFTGVDALIAQMDKDSVQARESLAATAAFHSHLSEVRT